VVGDTVVVRSNTVALIFRRNQSGQKSMVEARLSSQGKIHPEAAVIDGENLYTTDQTKGVVLVLDARTGKKKTEFSAPEKPVSLAVRDGLWVLDASGALYKLALPGGEVLFRVLLEGTPQRLRLTDQYAFVADAQGFVSVVEVKNRTVSARKRFQNPTMSLSVMPDGHVALALEKRGIVVVDSTLKVVRTIY
jgi:outer membrane protein assembly factor BamB